MALSRLVVVLAGLLYCAGVAAQPQAPPVPPSPTSLSADWWSYFEAPAESLTERVRALTTALAELRQQLRMGAELATREQALSLVDEITALAARYPQTRERSAPGYEPLAPAAERYTPEQLLQIGADLREARLDLEFERDEATRQEQALRAANARINDAKAAYLALSADAPERLVAGLSIMRDRLAWAIRQQDLRLRRARVDVLVERVKALETRLAAAGDRLSIEPAQLAEVRGSLAAASARAEDLRREASTLRLQDAGLGESPADRARARYQSQQLLDQEVQAAAASLEVSRLQLELALGNYASDGGDDALAALREQRRQSEAAAAALEEQVRIWRRTSNRERAAAAAQLALAEREEPALTRIHRQRVTLADGTLQRLNRLDQGLSGATLIIEVATRRIVQGGGRIEDVISRTGDTLGELVSTLGDWTAASLFEINDTPVTVVGLFRVALILFLAWWASKLLAKAIGRLMERRESMSRASLYTLQRLSTYAILTLGFFIGLSSIGIDFTKFALVISALGVGLGFGLQAIFSNFVAGLIILFEKSLKVGDFVELESGVHGEVREVNIRSTLITTNDNIDILVPNSEFVNGRVTNWTLREAFRRVRIPFGVAYGTDKDLVKKAALEAADTVPFTLKNSPGRDPRVWLIAFGDSSLDFELVVWLTTDAVKRPSAVQAAYTWELDTALRRHGIEIPFPQRDLHLRSVMGRTDPAAAAGISDAPDAAPAR